MPKLDTSEKILKWQIAIEEKKKKINQLTEEIKKLEEKIDAEILKNAKSTTAKIEQLIAKNGITDQMQLEMILSQVENTIKNSQTADS